MILTPRTVPYRSFLLHYPVHHDSEGEGGEREKKREKGWVCWFIAREKAPDPKVGGGSDSGRSKDREKVNNVKKKKKEFTVSFDRTRQ